MPRSIFIFPNLHCLSIYKCFLKTPYLTSRKSYPLPTALAHRCTQDTREAETSLPTLITTVHFQTCDKEVTSELQVLPLPNPQSCCPELKMSIKRAHKFTMTCILYDFSFGKYMPPHTLGFQFNELRQFFSVSSSFQIIQRLGPETVNHFTFWIITIPSWSTFS